MREPLVLITIVALCAACAKDGPPPCPGVPPVPELPPTHVLLQPGSPELNQVAPDSFAARFTTTKGDVLVRVYRAWAPIGTDRFYNLARNGFYDGSRFFRVLPDFIVQFGLNGHPEVDEAWLEDSIPDDPPQRANDVATIVFATRGPNTRSTQLFFNYRDNPNLDAEGVFAPFGVVTSGLDVLLRLYSGYGEFPPAGNGPRYDCMLSHGNAYLDRYFANLDRIERVSISP
jgi:peptidyl-prolyl cis-trans isomerase A (cyclophilin A)